MKSSNWSLVGDAECYAVALYNFSGFGVEKSICFSVGDCIYILQRNACWYFGYSARNQAFRGIFPCNYVYIKKCIVDRNTAGGRLVLPKQNPICQEVSLVVEEWNQIYKQLYLMRSDKMNQIMDMIIKLLSLRKKLITDYLPLDGLRSIKHQITDIIDEGNKILELDLVVRDRSGNIVNPNLISPIQLYKLHLISEERCLPKITLNNEILKRNVSICKDDEYLLIFTIEDCPIFRHDISPASYDLSLFMFNTDTHKVVSEFFIFTLREENFNSDLLSLRNEKIIFKDIRVNQSEYDSLYIVCTVVKHVKFTFDSSSINFYFNKSKPYTFQFKKLFGVALIELSNCNVHCHLDIGHTPVSVYDECSLFGEHDFGENRSLQPSEISTSIGKCINNNKFMTFIQCCNKDTLDSILRRIKTFKDGVWKENRHSMISIVAEFISVKFFLTVTESMNHSSGCISHTRNELPFILLSDYFLHSRSDLHPHNIHFVRYFSFHPTSLLARVINIYGANHSQYDTIICNNHHRLSQNSSLDSVGNTTSTDIGTCVSSKIEVTSLLHVTLLYADLMRTTKSHDRNIQVIVSVMNNSGGLVENCVQTGISRINSKYYSVINYRDSKPFWLEQFTLINLSPEQYENCHLKFLFIHRSINVKDLSEKPFAIAYLKLKQSNGLVVENGRHLLNIYKINTNNYSADDTNYIFLPDKVSNIVDGKSNFTRNAFNLVTKDVFAIDITFFSTLLTQNAKLLSVFQCCSNDLNNDELATKCESDLGNVPEKSQDVSKQLHSISLIFEISSADIVCFLYSILDILFSVLDKFHSIEFEIIAFRSLLFVISTVFDVASTNSVNSEQESIIDIYVKNYFSSLSAHKKLLKIIQHLLADLNDTNTCEILMNAFGHMRYLLQFCLQSVNLSLRMFTEIDDPCQTIVKQFNVSFLQLLNSFACIMLYTDDKFQPLMLKIIQHIPNAVCVELVTYYSDPLAICTFVVQLLQNSSRIDLIHRLNTVLQLMSSCLFSLAPCRNVLLPAFLSIIAQALHLKNSKENSCMSIDIYNYNFTLKSSRKKLSKYFGQSQSEISNAYDNTYIQFEYRKLSLGVHTLMILMDNLWNFSRISTINHDVTLVLTYLLVKVLRILAAVDRTESRLVGRLLAVLVSMLSLMEEDNYDALIKHFQDTDELIVLLIEIQMVFRDLIARSIYPVRWTDVIMLMNRVFLTCLRYVSQTVRNVFTNPFVFQVWNNLFHCLIAYVTQSSLQLESFSPRKRSYMLTRYEDIRHHVFDIIYTLWMSLGQHKFHFIPSLVSPFLELSMLPEPELRAATIPLFFDMMQCEFYSKSNITDKMAINECEDVSSMTNNHGNDCKYNFKLFRNELINKLDHLMEGGKGDSHYVAVFCEKMTSYCQMHHAMRQQGLAMLKVVRDLMQHILIYRETKRDGCMQAFMNTTVVLLHFYKNNDCEDLYLRYIHKLVTLHLSLGYYNEAAFTLKLHADLLTWSEVDMVSSAHRHGRYSKHLTHAELKQTLYNDVIDYFERGKLWEPALQICKSLCCRYEEVCFDYEQLSKTHERMARFYKNIISEIRPTHSYFRVGFYGRGFHTYLQNQVFIHRGKDYERVGEFTNRMMNEFTDAELLPSLSPPTDDIKDSELQYLQINKVEVNTTDISFMKEKCVFEKILEYYNNNEVRHFHYSRPLSVNNDSECKSNPFANLWLQRTEIVTAENLPGLVPWSSVLNSVVRNISPIVNAINTMTSSNDHIRRLISSYQRDTNLHLNTLTQSLSGIIDAAVNGGILNYQEAFFVSDFSNNQYSIEELQKLKQLIIEQLPLLNLALKIHKSRVPDSLVPLQKRLEHLFSNMTSDIFTKMNVDTSKYSLSSLNRYSITTNSSNTTDLSSSSIINDECSKLSFYNMSDEVFNMSLSKSEHSSNDPDTILKLSMEQLPTKYNHNQSNRRSLSESESSHSTMFPLPSRF